MKNLLLFFILFSIFSCESPNSNSYLNWKNYLDTSNDYQSLLVQIAQIDGLTRKDHQRGQYEEICFGDIDETYSESTANFWACVVRFSQSDWNVNLQFTEQLKSEYDKNVRDIKANLEFETKAYRRFCNCEVEAYIKPSGRYVNIFESVSGDGTKKYNIIIEY